MGGLPRRRGPSGRNSVTAHIQLTVAVDRASWDQWILTVIVPHRDHQQDRDWGAQYLVPDWVSRLYAVCDSEECNNIERLPFWFLACTLRRHGFALDVMNSYQRGITGPSGELWPDTKDSICWRSHACGSCYPITGSPLPCVHLASQQSTLQPKSRIRTEEISSVAWHWDRKQLHVGHMLEFLDKPKARAFGIGALCSSYGGLCLPKFCNCSDCSVFIWGRTSVLECVEISSCVLPTLGTQHDIDF